jgi:diaminohydroxyphosphoribosylaminopyrimidine deaminase / 5-amino-6-(5-phosphoribosylamino)uracil reductase
MTQTGARLFSDFDRHAMQRALILAARGLESTDPNPRVGCVIAQRGRIIAEGWHERAGEAHAEIVALRGAGAQAVGATVYVSLEPCNHEGRTAPCTDSLIGARVARVVYAVGDPNPQVNGQGAAALAAAGIQVDSGLLEEEATALNAGFMKRMRAGRPLVRVKLAMSLDGRTALASGESRWITGEAAREDVQRWRARSSAVVTGVGTVLADDPRLDVRLACAQGAPERRHPMRVILDSRLRTPPGSRLFEGGGDLLILTISGAADDKRAAALAARGAHVELLPGESGRVSLPAVLDRLAELEMNEVLVEAGATLAGEVLRQGLADELLLYIGPRLLGPSARALIELPEVTALKDAPSFTLLESQQIGEDLRLRLVPRAG